MKRYTSHLTLFSILTLILIPSAHATDVTIPNSFQSGATARSSEVNANFSAVETAVDDNHSRIAELESTVSTLLETITTLQNRITELEESQVMSLDPYVSVDEVTDSRGPLVQFSGVNLQIVNGEEATDTINGLGNLIVGYDEVNTDVFYEYCSDGAYDNEIDCVDNDETWGNSHKTGSHYLVLGSRNNYSRFGGLVSGYGNFSTGEFSNVSGGRNNAATAEYSSVSGGSGNDASGSTSSVSGGHGNIASATNSSVNGGYTNIASGYVSSVLGGWNNTASGNQSCVSGGAYNTAFGSLSSVSGGRYNDADGSASSISGGSDDDVTGDWDWAAGDSYFADQ
jgi:hypothetical protein